MKTHTHALPEPTSAEGVAALRLSEGLRLYSGTIDTSISAPRDDDFIAKTESIEHGLQFSGSQLTPFQQIALSSSRVFPQLPSVIAATWFDFFSADRDWSPTRSFDQTAISRLIQATHQGGIGISASLVKKREDCLGTSFIVPSGAYLTWLEMEHEKFDD